VSSGDGRVGPSCSLPIICFALLPNTNRFLIDARSNPAAR
jgi:hypothetical protein